MCIAHSLFSSFVTVLSLYMTPLLLAISSLILFYFTYFLRDIIFVGPTLSLSHTHSHSHSHYAQVGVGGEQASYDVFLILFHFHFQTLNFLFWCIHWFQPNPLALCVYLSDLTLLVSDHSV
jgi:hypothetical protein